MTGLITRIVPGGISPPFDSRGPRYAEPDLAPAATPYRIEHFNHRAGHALLHGIPRSPWRGVTGPVVGLFSGGGGHHMPLIDLQTSVWDNADPAPPAVEVKLDHLFTKVVDAPAFDGSTDPRGVDGVVLNILQHEHHVKLSTANLLTIRAGGTVVKETAALNFLSTDPDWLVDGLVVVPPLGYNTEPKAWRYHSHLVAFSTAAFADWPDDGWAIRG